VHFLSFVTLVELRENKTQHESEFSGNTRLIVFIGHGERALATVLAVAVVGV